MPTTAPDKIWMQQVEKRSFHFIAWGALIFLTALAVRLTITFQLFQHSPLFAHPLIDAMKYDDLAKALVRSWLWPENAPFFQPPAYPYFLAVIYRLFGESYLAVRVVQSCLGP